MKYSNTFMLFLIALTLGSVYLFYFKPRIEEQKVIEDFEKRFFRADTSDLEFIRLDSGQGPVTVVKNGANWRITKPVEYEADTGAIENLLNVLSKGRLLKLVGDKGDLDAFGFKTVHVILTLGYKGTIDVLKIAGESPSTAGHYAYSERLGKIFLVNKEFAEAVNLKPLDLREKRVFSFIPEELKQVKIQREQDTVVLEKRQDAWKMLSPLTVHADSDDMKNLIDTFYTLKTEAFLEWSPELEKLDKKVFVELINDQGVSTGQADIYFWGTEWDKGIVVHHPGSGEALRVRREFWNILNEHYTGFAYRNVISVRSNVKRMTVHSGQERYILTNQGGQWNIENSPLPVEAMNELLDFLKDWKAEKLIAENRELGQKLLELEVDYDGVTDSVTVTDFNMDYEITGPGVFAARKGKIKKEKVDFLYAYSSNLKSSLLVSSVDVHSIIDMVRSMVDD